MADCLVLWDFEIEIYLHTTLVGVSRHSIPGTSWHKLSHTHLKLAGRNDLLNKHSVDYAVVALLKSTEVHLNCILAGCQVVRIGCVSR